MDQILCVHFPYVVPPAVLEIPSAPRRYAHFLLGFWPDLLRAMVSKELTRELRKHGFSVPTNRWFRGDLTRYFRDNLTSTQARNRGYFNPRSVDTIITEHTGGKRNWDAQLGRLLSFELSAQRYLDDRPAPEGGIPLGRLAQGPCLVESESAPI